MRLTAVREENRRLLVSVGAALLLHIALGAIILALPEKKTSRADRRGVLRVSLSAPAQDAGRQEDALHGVSPDGEIAEKGLTETPDVDDSDTSGAPSGGGPAERPSPATPLTAAPDTAPSPAPITEPTPAPAGEEERSAAATLPGENEETGSFGGASDSEVGGSERDERSGGSDRAVPPTGLTNENGREGGSTDGQSLPTLEPTRYVAPEYPESARRSGLTGTTTLAITIGRRGRVESVDLVESSGYDSLDEAAMRAVRLWRFSRDRNGEKSLHRFDFRLE